MKNKIQLVTGILAMYILSLPIVLAFHSTEHAEHTKHTINVVSNDFTNIVAEDSSDCHICSFYFDQQLYVQNSFVFELDTFSYFFHPGVVVEALIIVSQEQYYLRGPPLA